MLGLRVVTPDEWLKVVLGDFDSFLIDHAACERKAAATGMMFVVRYPDRADLVRTMIDFAREELDHFRMVYELMEARGLSLGPDYKDEYANALLKRQRSSRDDLLLDRLLISGIIEARGCERLKLVTDTLGDDDPRRAPYQEMTRAEARHHALFFRFARQYFDEELVNARADELLDHEAEVIAKLPIRAAVH